VRRLELVDRIDPRLSRLRLAACHRSGDHEYGGQCWKRSSIRACWSATRTRRFISTPRPPASITIETDDCRTTVEELKSRGVEFVSDVLEFPWGYVAQFKDPDGNRL
jgi:hypothetical protein